MRHIEYRGPHPAVDVPLYQLGGIAARTPVEVSDDVAAHLTLDGTSATWIDVTDDVEAAARQAAGEAKTRRAAGATTTATEG